MQKYMCAKVGNDQAVDVSQAEHGALKQTFASERLLRLSKIIIVKMTNITPPS